MTYIPHFNFPKFIEMAELLRWWGHDVVSPAELDSPEERAAAMASPDGHPIHYANGKTWGDFLARDVKLLADSDIEGVLVLPGWEKSRGARLETFVAYALCDKPVYTWDSAAAAPKRVPDLALFKAWCAEPLLSVHATFTMREFAQREEVPA
jgi:hypothetical protein